MSKNQVRVTLTVMKGPDRGKTCELTEDEALIGRGSKALALSDPSISQNHFKIILKGSEVWVEDLGSRNGTYFKDQKIDRKRVDNLDEVSAGKSIFRIFVLENLGTLKTKIEQDEDGETSPKGIKSMIEDELQQFSKWDLGETQTTELVEEEHHVEPYLLRIVSHEGEEYEVRVRRSLAMIGRTKTDIEIPDPDISRLHAALEYEGPRRVRIKDMGSTNGVWVNGKKVKDVLLQDHDKIQMGSTLVEVVLVEK